MSIHPTQQMNWIDVPGWVVQGQFVNKPASKKEKKMQIAVDTCESRDTALEHLEKRIRDIYNNKYAELKPKFNLVSKRPKNFKEAKKWMDDGYFRFAPYNEDDNCFYCMSSHFSWGTETPDHDGFNKAEKELSKAMTAARDIIRVTTDADKRLKALKDFESYKI